MRDGGSVVVRFKAWEKLFPIERDHTGIQSIDILPNL